MDNQVLPALLSEQADLRLPDSGELDVFCWRLEQLERAGYSGASAHLLADSNEVDLHLACDLIASGCPERTAYAILS